MTAVTNILSWRVDRKLVVAICVAQLLSFLLCITGVTSATLGGKGINAPGTQSLINYGLLAITCSFVHLKQSQWKWRMSNAWYIYFLLAVLDVEANFVVTKAYQYTSITSVTLLDCFTIPAVMVLSYMIFRARYSVGHLMGAALCVLGLTVLVLTDSASMTGGPRPALGDSLVLLGAMIYAICNVAQEKLLVEASSWELLAHVGIFGTMIGGTQAAILEHDAWTDATWDGAAIGAMLGFAAALYCFYLLVPVVLTKGGSTVLNLSLLTSDLWAAGARAVLFGGFGGTGGYFAISLCVEAVGIVVYTMSGTTHDPSVHKQRIQMSSTMSEGDDFDRQCLIPKTFSNDGGQESDRLSSEIVSDEADEDKAKLLSSSSDVVVNVNRSSHHHHHHQPTASSQVPA